MTNNCCSLSKRSARATELLSFKHKGISLLRNLGRYVVIFLYSVTVTKGSKIISVIHVTFW